MAYYVATGMTPEQESYLIETTGKLVSMNDEIIRRQKEEEARRRWTIIIGAVSAGIAALKFGWIVVPTIRQRRLAAKGEGI